MCHKDPKLKTLLTFVALDAVEDEVVLPALVQLVDLLRHLLDALLDAVHPVKQLITLHGQLRRGEYCLLGLLEAFFPNVP